MNFEMKKLGVDEVEIDIKSLIKRCIENWKIVLAMGLICAILLPLAMYVKALSSAQIQDGNTQVEQVELSIEDQAVVDEYLILEDKKYELEQFMENSALMDMDFANVYKTRMQFYFGNNDAKKFDIANSVRNYILNGVIEYAINDSLSNGEKRVSSELISVAILEGSGILNVEVLAKDEAQCEKYIEILTSLVKEYSDTLQNSIGSHSFEIIESRGKFVSVQNVYDKQREYLQSYKGVLTYMSTLESSFNTTQREYLSALNGIQNDESAVVDVVAPKIEIKYTIVGLGIGVVLAIGIIVLFALFGGRVQSEYEIQKRLQIAYLGLVGYKQDEMVIAKINAMLSKQDINNIKFISSSSYVNQDKISAVIEGLKNNKISCVGVENLLTENKTVESLSQESNVIIVESIGKTKISELYQEALFCKEMNANIVGYLML